MLSSIIGRRELLLILFCLVGISQYSSAQNSKPNILLIMTDQQAGFAIGASGNEDIITPNLDRLVSEGAYFSRAVTPCPVCVPARMAILTGRLLETSGIRNNRDAKKDSEYPSFDEILSKNGYRAEYYGKYHSPQNMTGVYANPEKNGQGGPEQIIKWQSNYEQLIEREVERRPLKKGELYETTFYGGMIPYKLSPLDRKYDYLPSGELPEDELKQRSFGQGDVHGVLDLPDDYTITAVQAKDAISAMDRLKDTQFILTCSFHCPHVPITPTQKYVSMYRREDITIPESMHDPGENSPYSPKKYKGMYSNEDLLPDMILNYYAFVTEIDDWVGRIINKLDELGLSENTLVIFVSDHGEMLGAHGLRGKFNFYEESVQVPLIFKYPGKIKSGQILETPVSTLNIFSTILDYAGIEEIPNDGYSLRGMMEGEPAPYDFAVSEWDWNNQNVPSIMIRTKEWKLMTTHRQGGKDVEVLIDLRNDPYEMNNLLGSNPDRSQYKEIVEELRSKLVGYLENTGFPLTREIERREIIH